VAPPQGTARARARLTSRLTHPYPVELDLPVWTVERDIDLRNWLFGFGAGIRIEAPRALREKHQQKLQASAVYQPA
jgi:hypothetical protein